MHLRQAIEQFLEHLALERNYSQHTVQAYRTDLLGGSPGGRGSYGFLEHMVAMSGEEEPLLASVTQREVRSFLGALHRASRARRSIARKLAAVKSLMRFCVSRGHRDDNPAIGVRSPKLEKRLPTVLDRSEAAALMSAPDAGSATGARDRAILELLYSSGIRRGELASIELRDVDLHSLQLRVLGKGRKERIVPFGTAAANALRSYLHRRDALLNEGTSTALFIGENGAPLSTNAIYRLVRRYMGSVTEQTRKSPHVLRHSFATHLLDAGAGLREVGELLGHSSLASTQVYTHVTVERLKKAYLHAHPRSGGEKSK